MKKTLNIFYLCLSVGMLIYAVPQLQVGKGLTLPTVFTVVWLAFALTIIAAHLFETLRVDIEENAALMKQKRMQSTQFNH